MVQLQKCSFCKLAVLTCAATVDIELLQSICIWYEVSVFVLGCNVEIESERPTLP